MFDNLIAVLSGDHPFTSLFDATNLRNVHFTASFLGAMMALYVMQLWTVGALYIANDCWLSRQARRVALMAVAVAMLWSLGFQDAKNWAPWPSDVALILAVDMFLFSSIVVAIRKKRALG